MDPKVEEQIANILLRYIEIEEGIGEASGGSGHLSHTTISLDNTEIRKTSEIDFSYRVKVAYTKSIETEFTYYPDNPPHEYVYTQILYLTSDLEISNSEEKELVSTNIDPGLFFDLDDTE